MRKVLMGNHAISVGVKLSRVQVISAYPITPQTQVVELLSEIVANRELDAEFIKVESEHSALTSCIGASAVGARAFTATSCQGLLLMHEALHWASRGRLPIVMANINRAIFPGWTIWADQNDSLSQRDTGWIQWYASDNQEVMDSVILGYKIAEQVMLPLMINLDAFFLSHTYEAVEVPEQEIIDGFLPPFNPEWKLDVDKPAAFGGLTSPNIYMEFQYKIFNEMAKSLKIIEKAGQEYHKLTGRYYGNIEEYKCSDAEIIIVTSGTIARTANIVIDDLRNRGIKAGNLRIRTFRPFPQEEVYEIIKGAAKVFVVDRNISFGHSGIFYEELKAAMYNKPQRPPIFGFVAGLGGRDVTPETIHQIFEIGQKKSSPEEEVIWIGVNK